MHRRWRKSERVWKQSSLWMVWFVGFIRWAECGIGNCKFKGIGHSLVGESRQERAFNDVFPSPVARARAFSLQWSNHHTI